MPGNKRILVVEDDPHCRSFLIDALVASGWSCISAECATDARTLMRNETFDLAVLDLYLPDESGAELAWFMKHRHPGTPVIAVSGLLHEGNKQILARLGVRASFQKPLDVGEFLAAVGREIQQAQEQRQ